MTSETATAVRPAGRTLKIIAVLMLVLGIAAVATGVTGIVRTVGTAFVDSVDGPVYTVPFRVDLTAHKGTNLIMQDNSYGNNVGSNFATATIGPGDVALTDPNGAPVVPTSTGGHYTVSRNGDSFVDIMKFHADAAGQYHLEILAPAGLRLIVAPSLGESFGHAVGWISTAGLGVLVVLGGIVVLIIGFSQAGRAGRGTPVPYAGYGNYNPPPGWYPDPGDPASTRWWDGYRWRP